MSLNQAQKAALAHLRAAYAGPEGGDDEVVINPPNVQYAVGMLFPQRTSGDPESYGRVEDPGLEDDGQTDDDVTAIPLSEEWNPSSAAISFVTDGTSVVCDLAGGTYERIDERGSSRWRRRPFAINDLVIAKGDEPHALTANGVKIEIGARWRGYGTGYLTTVYVRVREHSIGDARQDVGHMIYQVALEVRAAEEGRFAEYGPAYEYHPDGESAELRLRYRNKRIFAVGHGLAADWALEEDGACRRIWLESVPHFVVPAIEATAFEPDDPAAAALRLSHLERIDAQPDEVVDSLRLFVDAFEEWVNQEEVRAAGLREDLTVARRIVARARRAHERMRETLQLLASPGQDDLRTAFALAMKAMRLQMTQTRIKRGMAPGEPAWRPFQLGFLLVALPSTVDGEHEDRELVDLIWFPTGGGKTEAYLALAAVEIFRRRLVEGVAGGGTAVITRYTLRLLTSQQFQRTATLICAMELLRRSGEASDPRAAGMVPFTIGLWVGNDVTPGTLRDAREEVKHLLKVARPTEANSFQMESCPWCGADLLPAVRADDPAAYGIAIVGDEVVVRCLDPECPFHSEIPVVLVDEAIYKQPPTIVLATVDKFARLQFAPAAGSILGLGTPYRQPSMIIQDEMHLLSGPLGTTVAMFDAVVQSLLSREGSAPKVIASTATVRAADDQVRGLYGREVALYPPAGLDDDSSFFSRPVASGEGRMYVGLMPQAMPQLSAVVATTAPILELPYVLRDSEGTDLDAYWTAVLYHNSLRELGRTGTLIVDDVNGRLAARADRLGLETRHVGGDKVLELTSRKGPEELPKDLKTLEKRVGESREAVDAVLSSNMLSVGVDIPRLALMLMLGQPKTTSEYIQATSRVGRSDAVRGIVVTLFRSNRARDRSYYETFRSYHESLYRSVEPTSVTPWSVSSRERSLPGALVALVRHTIPRLANDDHAGDLDLEDASLARQIDVVVEELVDSVRRADPVEADETEQEIGRLLREWNRRAHRAREEMDPLYYDRRTGVKNALFKRVGQSGEGWIVADSMRSVEPNTCVEVREPKEEIKRGTHQA